MHQLQPTTNVPTSSLSGKHPLHFALLGVFLFTGLLIPNLVFANNTGQQGHRMPQLSNYTWAFPLSGNYQLKEWLPTRAGMLFGFRENSAKLSLVKSSFETCESNFQVYTTCDGDPMESREISNSSQTCATLEYAFYSGNLTNNFNSNPHYSVQSNTFEEYENGSAYLSMRVVNNSDPDLIFNIEAVLKGRTFTAPANNPKENIQCVGDLDNSDWYYYTEVEGVLTGAGDLAGGKVLFSDTGAEFQIGTGANLNNANVFGASGWLSYAGKIVSHPNSGTLFLETGHADFNLNLTGNSLVGRSTTNSCLTICEGGSVTLTANTAFGTGPYQFSWSNGSDAATITVSPDETETYSVVVTDRNGCQNTDATEVKVEKGKIDQLVIFDLDKVNLDYT